MPGIIGVSIARIVWMISLPSANAVLNGFKEDRYIKTGLTLLGLIGVFIGVCVILSGVFLIRPKVDSLTDILDQDLSFLESNLDAMSKNMLLVESVLDIGKTTADLTNAIPATVVSLNGTVLQTAYALEQMGSTLDSIESGITGIVLPKDKIGKNISSLQKVAVQLRMLTAMTQSMESMLRRIRRDSINVSKEIVSLRNGLPEIKLFMTELRSQIQSARNVIHEHLLSRTIATGSFFCGGLYCFLGFLFLVLAMIYTKIERLSWLIFFRHVATPEKKNAA